MFRGSMVALVTPMHGDGAVDDRALRALLDWHVDSGTDAIVAVGTTGESATLSVPEHAEVIRRTVEHVAGRLPVIAGTGANATAEAVELTRHAKVAGADAALLVTPYYNKPTQEGLYRHFRTVAESVELPQILYNVPGRTALDMSPQTTARLSRLANVVGIKEALGRVSRIVELLDRCEDGFDVITGDDSTATESMLAGGHGDISVVANVVPAEMAALCRAAMAGDRARAEAIEARIGAGIRLPLTPLDERCHATVRAALEKAGVLVPAAVADLVAEAGA